MKKLEVIDLVEVQPGVYETPKSIAVPKMCQKPHKEQDPLLDFVDGIQEGRKAMKSLLKIFGGL